MPTIIRLTTITLAFLCLTGCRSKLNDERCVEVSMGQTSLIQYDPPRGDQLLTVIIDSTPGVPVNAYLVLAKAQDAAETAIASNLEPRDCLAMKLKFEHETLEAKVPAGEAFVLLLAPASAKGGKVTIKSTGQ